MLNIADSYKESGTKENVDRFYQLLKETEDNTFLVQRKNMNEVNFYSACPISKEVFAEKQNRPMSDFNDRVIVYDLSAEALDNFQYYGKPLRMGTLKVSDFSDADDPTLLNETLTNSGLILNVDGVKYLVAQASICTLLKKASVSGTQLRKESNIFRNMHLASIFANKSHSANDNAKISFAARTDGKASKILCFTSAKYPLAKYTLLENISKDYGEVLKWEISNTAARVYVEFKDKAFKLGSTTMVPGIMVQASDVETMYHIALVCRAGNTSSYVIYDEDIISHDSTHDPRSEEDITYSDLKEIIDRLISEIPGIVSSYTDDIKSTKVTDGTFEKAKDFFTKFVTKELSFMPKKRRESIIDNLCDNVESGKEMTAEDILSAVTMIPAMQDDLHENLMHELRLCCANVRNDIKSYA